MIVDKNVLLALAQRCEAETGPDRELDVWIFGKVVDLIHGQPWADSDCEYAAEDADRTCGAPRFTASLDAAMTLVPEGWNWMTGNRDQPAARAYVENGKSAFVGFGTKRNPERQWFEVVAATPALALCAATLCARASLVGVDS